MPTSIGQKILRQAERALNEADRISELVAEEKGAVDGTLNLSVGPTVAPYILPQFIKEYTQRYPQVRLLIEEMKSGAMLDALWLGQIDAGVAIGGHRRDGILRYRYIQNRSGYISLKVVGVNFLSSSLRTLSMNRCG